MEKCNSDENVANIKDSDASLQKQWIIISKRDGNSKILPHGMIFVGRDDCDIVLSSSTVDKRHAVIFYNTTNQQFHVKDLNSAYGTYVNEKRIADKCYMKLNHSDRLRFGFGPDIFVIEKYRSPIIESKSCEPLLLISANIIKDSNTACVSRDTQPSNLKNFSLTMRSRSDEKRDSSPLSPIVSVNFHSAPQSPLSRTIPNISTQTSFLLNDNNGDIVPPMQSIPLNNEKFENNSSSSLSTVDSLDEIKPEKNKLNDKILSPVKENNSESTHSSWDMCNDDATTCHTNPVNVSKISSFADKNKESDLKDSSAAQICSAMAFIIPFDDKDNNKKKKLNIKDSIRKFAPPKPDSIEKPRTAKSINSGNSAYDSPTAQSKAKQENKIHQNRNQNALMISSLDRNDINGHLSDSATYLINRMLCSEPTVNDSNEMFVRRNSSVSSKKENLSPKVSPIEDKRSPSHSGEKDSGVSDDNRSESGTYTVELDQTNGELEMARKKIDEIFGIYDDSKCDFDLLPDIINSKPTTNSIDTALLTRDFSPLKTSGFTSSSLTSPKLLANYSLNANNIPQTENNIASNTTTFTRRKLPFIPNSGSQEKNSVNNDLVNESESKNSYNKAIGLPVVYSNTSLTRSLNNDHNSDLTSIHSQNCLAQNASHQTSHNLLWNSNTNQAKLNNTFNSHSAPSTPRSPLVARKILQLQSKEKLKVNNNRKNSWSHPSSDLDQYESWSLNSDESTDHSSNSGLSRNDSNVSSYSVPSKMKFNRAFALRRARLGIETPGIPVEIKKTNKANSTKSNQQNSYSDNNFSRSDGGRFSLRLTKNTTNNKPPNNKLNNQHNNQTNKLESKEQVNKLPVTRKLSGLSATKVANVNRSLTKPPQSDSEKYLVRLKGNVTPLQTKRQTNALQKSASFADSNNLNKNGDINSRGVSCFQVGKRLVSTKPHQLAQFDNSMRTKNFSPKTDIMSTSLMSYNGNESPASAVKNCQNQNKSSRELSALDSLVISAINQLSVKLRSSMRELLEKERLKQDIGSEIRVMIDEILPQVSSPDRRLIDSNDSNISRDLSNSLKNLKKVEQCFEVFSLLMDPNTYITRRSDKNYRNTGFFVVDV